MPIPISGLLGRAEVIHWHTGEDIRLTLYGENGSSTYFVILGYDLQRWRLALGADPEVTIPRLKIDRSVAEFKQIGDHLAITCYDSMFPIAKTFVQFSTEQVHELLEALQFRKNDPQ